MLLLGRKHHPRVTSDGNRLFPISDQDHFFFFLPSSLRKMPLRMGGAFRQRQVSKLRHNDHKPAFTSTSVPGNFSWLSFSCNVVHFSETQAYISTWTNRQQSDASSIKDPLGWRSFWRFQRLSLNLHTAATCTFRIVSTRETARLGRHYVSFY